MSASNNKQKETGKNVKSYRRIIMVIGLAAILVAGGVIASYFFLWGPDGSSSEKPATPEPTLGSPDAPVTIIEFADFQCPFCGAVAGKNQKVINYLKSKDPDWEPIVPNLRPYINKGQVKLIFQNFPFLGQESWWAAQASECAFKQGDFWEYYDKLWANQKGENKGAFSVDNLKKFAAELGLDTKAFTKCLDSEKIRQEVQEDKEEGQKRGVRGTPAFFINGQLISGAQPFSKVKELIEAELGKD